MEKFAFLLLVSIIGPALTLASPQLLEDEERQKGHVPDGPLFNSSPRDGGPIPAEVLDAHPKLSFLGNYNGLNHYVERNRVSQTEARAGCRSLGMLLVAPSSQAHLNWISAVTSDQDDYSWTDGTMIRNLQSFTYEENCQGSLCQPLPSGLFLASFNEYVGLTVSRYPNGTNALVRSRPVVSTWHYICVV